jgi:hypothetical protein
MTSSIKRAKNKGFAEWREWKNGGKPPHSKSGVEIVGGTKPFFEVIVNLIGTRDLGSISGPCRQPDERRRGMRIGWQIWHGEPPCGRELAQLESVTEREAVRGEEGEKRRAQTLRRREVQDGGVKPPLQVELEIGARRNDRREIPHSADSVRNDGFISLLDGATF